MGALLSEALRHPANSIVSLVTALCSESQRPVPPGLKEPECHICDPVVPEKTPSLHLSMGESGVIFKRFGGDNAEGGTVDLVARFLDISKGDAAKWLIERANLTYAGTPGGARLTKRTLPEGLRRSQEAKRELRPLTDAELQETLQGWQALDAQRECPEQQEVARRGLLPALQNGMLKAYRSDHCWQGAQVKNGALAFEITGPEGKPLAVKVRNPTSPTRKAQKYAYLIGGKQMPGWCNPAFYLSGRRSRCELWIEGELSGMAVALALESVGQGELRVQGVAGANASPHQQHLQEGDEVFIYADPNEAGYTARKKWAALATARNFHVWQLPTDLFGEGDACDTLNKVGVQAMGQKIMEAIQASKAVRQDTWAGVPFKYTASQSRLCKVTWQRDGQGQLVEREQVMTNFTVWIEKEVEVVDGSPETERFLHMAALLPDQPNPIRFVLKASEFDKMNWVVPKLGGSATILPGRQMKDDVRTAIQMLSQERGKQCVTCFKHTGWWNVGGEWAYLTAGVVIGKAGEVHGLEVELPGRLSRFALPAPESRPELAQEAVQASLALLELVPDSVGVVGLGAVYSAPLGRSKVSIWFQGQTGTNKTTWVALLQAHYGKDWSQDTLPESWHGSANGLEQITFLAKDILLVIDDFKPQGTNKQQSEMHAVAARLIQGVADGQGRTTLTAERQSRPAYHPRGTLLSSAEELPRGHSNRARMFSVPVSSPR